MRLRTGYASVLFSDEEFAARYVDAMRRLDERGFTIATAIESGDMNLPRASSIGSCAAKQLYRLRGDPQTDRVPAQYNWSSWMGTAGQEVTTAILREMGYEVQTDVDVLESDVMSGHVDGIISGLDLDEPMVWDSKLRNLYGFRTLVRDGISTDPEMYYQMQAYMHFLGLTRALVTVHPHDYSSQRLDARKFKMEIADTIVHRIFVAYDKDAAELAVARAETLQSARALNLMVAREFNPADGKWPCTFCGWMSRCLADDFERTAQGVVEVPPLPSEDTQ